MITHFGRDNTCYGGGHIHQVHLGRHGDSARESLDISGLPIDRSDVSQSLGRRRSVVHLSWLGVLLFEGCSDLGPGLAEEFTLPGTSQLQCAP